MREESEHIGGVQIRRERADMLHFADDIAVLMDSEEYLTLMLKEI